MAPAESTCGGRVAASARRRTSPAGTPDPDTDTDSTGADVGARLVRLVAAHLDVDPGRLLPETRLGEDLCVDSLGAVELTMAMEDEFDISLPDEVVADICTFGDVVAVVNGQRAARA